MEEFSWFALATVVLHWTVVIGLHTRSITVDGSFCLFGSVNLDMRSLWLNFELSLPIYNRALTSRIRDLQLGYIRDAAILNAAEWQRRPLPQRFFENAVHLAAPLP